MDEKKKSKVNRIIAACGKGGVGKTVIIAMMTKALSEEGGSKILVIDADPAVGLASALGIKVRKTINDLRNELIDTIKSKTKNNKYELASMLDYIVFDAIEEKSNFGLLAIGRPEDEGCYCQVNDLLKEVIESIGCDFDIVLIDGEAGIEQINRRVMKHVDDLLLITDTSIKGVNVVSTIQKVAEHNKAVDYKRMGLIVNKVRSKEELVRVTDSINIDLIGYIFDDDTIREYDLNGNPILDLPNENPSITSIQNILKRLDLLS